MQYHIREKPDCTVVLGHLEKNIAAALAPMMDKNVAGLISAGSRARAMKYIIMPFVVYKTACVYMFCRTYINFPPLKML